ncbi:OprO/OprP family phosphate-selective porin [Myxococcota bacterium]|nr:OprO/OprP family phosphate-selective porin [Myxococcota bacterium]
MTRTPLALALAVAAASHLGPGEVSGAEIVSVDAAKGGFDHLGVRLGGFLQPRFTLVPEDEAVGSAGELGFEVKRVRFELGATLKKELRPGVDLTISPAMSVELMPEPKLKDGYVEVGLGPWVHLRGGQFKAATSRTVLTSDRAILFPERAMLSQLVPDYEIGAQVAGSFGKRHVEYALGAFNGEGSNRISNVNRKMLWVGRVAVSPLGAPGRASELMAPAPAGPHRPTFTLGYAVHANVEGEPGEEEASMGHDVEAFLHWRWFTLQGEFLWKVVDFEDQAITDYRQSAWYAQMGMFLPAVPWAQEHLALLFRAEQADAYVPVGSDVPLAGATDPHQAQRAFGFGIGYYGSLPLFKAVGDLRLQAVYTVRQELEDQPYDNDEFVIAGHLAI